MPLPASLPFRTHSITPPGITPPTQTPDSTTCPPATSGEFGDGYLPYEERAIYLCLPCCSYGDLLWARHNGHYWPARFVRQTPGDDGVPAPLVEFVHDSDEFEITSDILAWDTMLCPPPGDAELRRLWAKTLIAAEKESAALAKERHRETVELDRHFAAFAPPAEEPSPAQATATSPPVPPAEAAAPQVPGPPPALAQHFDEQSETSLILQSGTDSRDKLHWNHAVINTCLPQTLTATRLRPALCHWHANRCRRQLQSSTNRPVTIT